MNARAVILGAGTSTRMGAQKLLMPFHGRSLIEYAIEASQPWDPMVVAGPEVAHALGGDPRIDLIVNESPERGMAYSLRLANAALPDDAALIVLLGDKPLVTTPFISRLCQALDDADVAYPVHARSGAPGHPVIFSPAARAKIEALPDGDTLSTLRDDPSLRRHTIETEEEGAFFDVDTPQDMSS